MASPRGTMDIENILEPLQTSFLIANDESIELAWNHVERFVLHVENQPHEMFNWKPVAGAVKYCEFHNEILSPI